MEQRGTETLERGGKLRLAVDAMWIEFRFIKPLPNNKARIQWAVEGGTVGSVVIDGPPDNPNRPSSTVIRKLDDGR